MDVLLRLEPIEAQEIYPSSYSMPRFPHGSFQHSCSSFLMSRISTGVLCGIASSIFAAANTLRAAGHARGIFMGTAIKSDMLEDQKYKDTLVNQYDLVTADSECK